MGPNASRILYRLGLGVALDREAVRPASTHQRRWQDSRTLQRAPLNPLYEELYGAPHLTVHRADLLAIIASGFPPERVYLGHRLVGLADRGDHVDAWFQNGLRITADVLVGADGINSTVRAALLGQEAPRFAGCVADRGLGADDLVETLRRYEELRRPRVTRLQEMSRANKTRFHLPDGPAQEARDAEWARAGDRSPDALRWLYEFDATALPRS